MTGWPPAGPEAVLARLRADLKPSGAAAVAEAGQTTASSIPSLRIHTGQARRRARLICASAGQEG